MTRLNCSLAVGGLDDQMVAVRSPDRRSAAARMAPTIVAPGIADPYTPIGPDDKRVPPAQSRSTT